MTLDQAYTLNAGTSILIPGGGSGNAGQCEQWADYVLHNVYGFPYLYTPGAINWWQNSTLASYGFQFIPYPNNGYPLAGDFVVWGTGVGSQYGHIDLCAIDGTADGFTGYDSNWEDIPRLTTINHNYAYDVLGFIRLGEDMTATSEMLQVLYYLGVPNQPVNMDWVNAWVGKDMSAAENALRDDPSRQSYITTLVNDAAAYQNSDADQQIAQIKTIVNQ